MVSLRPGEKLYVRFFAGSRCNFLPSLPDLPVLFQVAPFSRSSPEGVVSWPARSLCARMMGSEVRATSLFFLLRLVFLRNGQIPIFPFVGRRCCLSTTQILNVNVVLHPELPWLLDRNSYAQLSTCSACGWRGRPCYGFNLYAGRRKVGVWRASFAWLCMNSALEM